MSNLKKKKNGKGKGKGNRKKETGKTSGSSGR